MSHRNEINKHSEKDLRSLILAAIFMLLATPSLADDGCWSIVPGVENRPDCMPSMSSYQCLKLYPEDKVGGFCEWYGYSSHAQVERFEKKRGCIHKYPYDSSRGPESGNNNLWVCHVKN